MLLSTFLHTAFLASFFASWISFPATAAPIPNTTKFANTNHPQHNALVDAAKSQSSANRPKTGAVHLHPVARTNGHLTGSVLIRNPQHINGMSMPDLHAHAQAAKDAIKKENPHAQYHVQAHHTPGDAHVMIHAVPKHHVATDRTTGIAQHAMRFAGPSQPNAPRASSHQTRRINEGLNEKRRPTDGSPRSEHFTHQHSTHHPDPGVHAPVKTARIPVARSDLRQGMTAGELHAHVEWINKNLVPDKYQDKVHIHASHEPGNAHIDYHITNPRTRVTHTEIRSFLNKQDDRHFSERDSMTGSANPTPGNHQYTFAGTVPAHTKRTMTTDQMDVYAAHTKEKLIEVKDLIGQDAREMVVATAHKRGQGLVDFHTQPKTDKFLETLQKKGYRPMERALIEADHVKVTVKGTALPNRHADQAVLEQSARRHHIPQADSETFRRHIDGQVLGIAGAGDKPCNKCDRTFKVLDGGVTYTDMDRPIAW